MKQTPVKFLIEKPEGNLPCEVFAFFPKESYSNIAPGTFTSYSHIGQHSPCHIDYANECAEATEEQYLPLLRELEGQGYDNLKVLNKPQNKPEETTVSHNEGEENTTLIEGLQLGKSMPHLNKTNVLMSDGHKLFTILHEDYTTENTRMQIDWLCQQAPTLYRENKELREALGNLTKEIKAAGLKLNVKKHYSLLVAESWADKLLRRINTNHFS